MCLENRSDLFAALQNARKWSCTQKMFHLVLQCGKLFQNVAQLVSLSGAVMTVDLYQTAEWL